VYKPDLTEDTPPWYRQGWPWMLIALPASAVVGGIITIILAVQSPNALVVDDYYKQGLAINQEKRRHAVAEEMALGGLLRSDGKRVSLDLRSDEPVEQEALVLRVIHSTRAELDQQAVLQRSADGIYSAALEPIRNGRWYLQVYPQDMSWKIRSEMTVDGNFQTYLR
jgi:hypothetical protein